MPLLVYDLKQMRPGCALLQAALGGDMGIANRFPVESWLVDLTPDLKRYKLSDEEFKKVIRYHGGIG